MTWTRDQEVYVAPEAGLLRRVSDAAVESDLVEDGVIYHSLDRQRVALRPVAQNGEPDGEEVLLAEAAEGERLFARVGRAEDQVIVLRASIDGVTASLLALDGTVLNGPMPIPSQGVDDDGWARPPAVDAHGAPARLLVAGAEGDAMGLRVYAWAGGEPTLVDAAPARHAVFTPPGDGVVRLASEGRAHRVEYRALEADASWVTLLGPSPYLTDQPLDWAGFEGVLRDGDNDGRADPDDPCPGRPAYTLSAPVAVGARPHAGLRWVGDTYVGLYADPLYYTNNSGVPWLMRFTSAGVVSNDLRLEGLSYTPDILWWGGRYHIVWQTRDLVGRGEVPEEVFIRPMNMAWELGEARRLYGRVHGPRLKLFASDGRMQLALVGSTVGWWRIMQLNVEQAPMFLSPEFAERRYRCGSEAPTVTSDGHGGLYATCTPGQSGNKHTQILHLSDRGVVLRDVSSAIVPSIGTDHLRPGRQRAVAFNGQTVYEVRYGADGALRGQRYGPQLNVDAVDSSVSGDVQIPEGVWSRFNVAVASGGNRFVVAFVGEDADGVGVFTTGIDDAGVPLLPPRRMSPIGLDVESPQIAWNGEAFGLSYFVRDGDQGRTHNGVTQMVEGRFDCR